MIILTYAGLPRDIKKRTPEKMVVRIYKESEEKISVIYGNLYSLYQRTYQKKFTTNNKPSNKNRWNLINFQKFDVKKTGKIRKKIENENQKRK